MQSNHRLQDRIDEIISEGYRCHSRIHPIRSLSTSEVNSYIKRDDELSFSISGSKIRKYLSLIPFLKNKQVEEVLLIGGAYSNHVMGLTQLLIENGMKPILFLRQAANEILRGNRFFIELMVPSKDIHWISRTDWPHVEEIARSHALESEKQSVVIPEGACMAEALIGALTLPLDIMRNQAEHGITFDHIFIDAGTGLQAIALILGLALVNHPAQVHVILLADDQATFNLKLKKFHETFDIPYPTNYQLYRPHVAASFGSVNTQVMAKVIEIARKEGFFLDPIYTAKLFIEGTKIIEESHLKGNILFVHSGGALALTGYQEAIGGLL